jgi:hypothetical protein
MKHRNHGGAGHPKVCHDFRMKGKREKRPHRASCQLPLQQFISGMVKNDAEWLGSAVGEERAKAEWIGNLACNVEVDGLEHREYSRA